METSGKPEREHTRQLIYRKRLMKEKQRRKKTKKVILKTNTRRVRVGGALETTKVCVGRNKKQM